MASPDRYTSCVVDDEKYLFTLNHEGRWAAEDLLDKEWPEIAYAYDTGRLGTRVQAAVVFALTRKHHRRELPGAPAVLRLLEKVEEADEETQLDFMAALDAAMTGRKKGEVLAEYEKAKAEVEEGEDVPADEEEGEAGDEADGAPGRPKGPEPSKDTGKPSRSRSGAGKSSSKKPQPRE